MVRFAGCPQPHQGECGTSKHPACMCRIYADAKRRCVERGEGWRWGVGDRS